MMNVNIYDNGAAFCVMEIRHHGDAGKRCVGIG